MWNKFYNIVFYCSSHLILPMVGVGIQQVLLLGDNLQL